MAISRPDGALPDVRRPGEVSFRCTAQAAAGLLAVLPELPEAEEAARRACACLSAWLTSPEARQAAVGPHSGKPADVLPLVEASRRWPETGWLFEATHIVDHGIHRPDVLAPFLRSEQSSARRVETLIAMDRKHTARQVLEEVTFHRRSYLLTARLAQLAALWYRVGLWEHADWAMCRLERLQRRDGSFPAHAGWLSPKTRRYRDTWTAKYYLDAALLRVRASFEARWQEFPQTIDDRDGRMRAVYDWFASLPVSARVADVGCGKGRFLRHLVRYFPAAQLVGIDVSPAMLSFLPPGVTARDGSILRTGLSDGELDGAFAVESLEHSLVPQRAIAELCRIVRPGGGILVIDKDRRRQPLSEHESWERWFTPEDLIRWMIPHCHDIAIRHVPHGEGLPGTDLFLAVTATRNEQ
jgi:SAM-dependent methyltransferase